jgi:hypothetical protein
VGLKIHGGSDTDAGVDKWVYLQSTLEVDADGRSAHLTDPSAEDQDVASMLKPFLEQIRDKARFDYGTAYQELIDAANKKLVRPLKDGFRMEGHLSSAKLEKVYLPADGVTIALRASGELRILYGL